MAQTKVTSSGIADDAVTVAKLSFTWNRIKLLIMAYIGREPTYGAFEKQTLVWNK